MKLSAHTESNSTAKGFLTYFTEVNGYGDWHRRWCVLKDLTLYFWKYPEDEQKRKAPIEVKSQGFNKQWRDQCPDPAMSCLFEFERQNITGCCKQTFRFQFN